ncbi:hypothetical protein [Burkholderia pseudomallei]|nr:hypothetical protein [Burkholderia pseudomallei]
MEFDSLHAPRFTRIVLTAVLAALSFGAANAQPASNDASDAVALRLAVERQVADRGIGDLEQVFSFTGAMPTGVAVDPHSRRIFVNFPRWGDDVPYTVGEIVGDKLVPYPDAQTNRAATDSPRGISSACRVSSQTAAASCGSSIRPRRVSRRRCRAARSSSRST